MADKMAPVDDKAAAMSDADYPPGLEQANTCTTWRNCRRAGRFPATAKTFTKKMLAVDGQPRELTLRPSIACRMGFQQFEF
jgi:hypothetical protein